VIEAVVPQSAASYLSEGTELKGIWLSQAVGGNASSSCGIGNHFKTGMGSEGRVVRLVVLTGGIVQGTIDCGTRTAHILFFPGGAFAEVKP
jgi:hypothetical protein